MIDEQIILRQLRKLASERHDANLTDRELLLRFAGQCDEAAFALLLQRHGPMILGLCRRILGNEQDAEDAFQATFLVLAQKGGSIRRQEAVGGWLYRVAYHIARKAQAATVNRRIRESQANASRQEDSPIEETWQELRHVLDEELQRLPEKYRAGLVLCYLDGKTRDEAAQELAWPLGTLKSRLERGRELLRARLSQRGVTFSTALLATALGVGTVSATVPGSLATATIRIAVMVAGGQEAVATAITPKITALAEGVAKAMYTTKLKMAATMLALALVVAGVGAFTQGRDRPAPPATGAGPVAPDVVGQDKASDPTKEGERWTVFRGDSAQNGVVKSRLPEKLKIRWQFTTKDAIEGAAAIRDGVVYIGSLDGHLYAIDLATGKEKWKYQGGPFKAAPSLRDGCVYIGDADGVFHCVDAGKGTRRWTINTASEIVSGANFAGDNILFGANDETLHAVSKDGKEVWKCKMQGAINGSPAVIGERVFVAGCDCNLHIIESARGSKLKSVPLLGQVGATPALRGDCAYVGTMTNELQAIEWKTGKILWTFKPERAPQPFYSSAAVTEDLVIVGCRNRRVYAIDRVKGTERWSFLTNGRVDSSPVVVDRRVFIGSLDGDLYVLDRKKGTLLEKFNLESAIIGSPAVAGGCLVIGTEQGTVYCFSE